ncbi:phage tail assembly chaperone [Propionispora vibrioides]|uniref:Phage XkdN-like tail assembly chaperone protein, TAC n=1 Tax=Propionispora vibrioides TaxID=112903 RepID=A0A1H8U5P2_9FIRM|nr:hypothetical protein [Propionispora vibrioides]SEO98600.1 Phage XkdN-like tail assembly chaperone protein, TAC [Propionispora vibrioides]
MANEEKVNEENSLLELTDEEILQKLLEVDSVPERTVSLKRLGIPVTLKALTGKQIYNIRERSMITVKTKRGRSRELDDEAFNCGLIAAATVKPNWGDAKLLSKFRASGPEEVVKRLLLGGEVAQLSDLVLEISEFNTELEEIKN